MTLSELFIRGAVSLIVICDVRTLRVASGAIVPAVPLAALARHGTGEYVFVLRSDQRIELRPVYLGPAVGRLVSVYGVDPGETIVYDAQRPNAPAAISKSAVEAPRH